MAQEIEPHRLPVIHIAPPSFLVPPAAPWLVGYAMKYFIVLVTRQWAGKVLFVTPSLWNPDHLRAGNCRFCGRCMQVRWRCLASTKRWVCRGRS